MKRYNGRTLSVMCLLSVLPGCFNQEQKQPVKPEAATTETAALATKIEEKKEEGAPVTTQSGLTYTITKPGTSETAAQPGKKVTVHYTGWLADEKGEPRLDAQFDSSHKRNQPFSFMLGIGQVIKGWDEGVKGMKIGEKRRLVIPSELGYGARGAGASIPPNAKLVFDVELLGVE